MPAIWIRGVLLMGALGLTGCGGDSTKAGSQIAGPTSVLQVNCPGSGPAAAPFSSNGGSGTVNQPSSRPAPMTAVDPEQRRGAESTALAGAPHSKPAQTNVVVNVPTPAPTVGDTHIDVGVDCGGDAVGSGGSAKVTNIAVERPRR
jgi:hypothetical protein